MSDRLQTPSGPRIQDSLIYRMVGRNRILAELITRYSRPIFYGLLTLAFLNVLEVFPPLLLMKTIDAIAAGSPFSLILGFAGAYVVVHFLQGVCRYGWRVFLVRSSISSGRDVRADFVKKLFELPPRFFDKNRIGDLMSKANGDVESVRQFVGSGLIVLADSVFFLITVPVAMFWLDARLALWVVAPMLAVPFVVLFFEGRIHSRFKASQDHFSKLSASAQESLNGVRLIKAFAIEDRVTRNFEKQGREYIDLNLRLARVQGTFGPLMDFFTSLGLVILLFKGSTLVLSDAITLGTMVAMQRYAQKLVWPMMALGFSVSFYQRARASSERLEEVFDQKNEILAPSQPGPRKISGTVEFRDLNFRYPGAERDALKGIRFVAEPGTRTALVGSIGSGKTTLLGLIPRFYLAPEGSIRIDGRPIEEFDLGILRRSIAFVSQDPYLFSETLARNVVWGDPENVDRSMDRIIEQSQLTHDLATLPEGRETLLGERGVNLSGGQRQRVAIARAWWIDAPILLFDDTLSAVDVHTEEKLLGALKQESASKTLILSSHRISSVREADQILVLHEGEIVDRGVHSDLIRKKDSLYSRYYEQQRRAEDLEQFLESQGGATS